MKNDQVMSALGLDDLRLVFDLACKLQDSDQCESHSTGDDCETGGIEHELFGTLSRIRVDSGNPAPTGTVRNPAPTPSSEKHILNSFDECVSWCVSCRENRERGFNPDGSEKS